MLLVMIQQTIPSYKNKVLENSIAGCETYPNLATNCDMDPMLEYLSFKDIGPDQPPL